MAQLIVKRPVHDERARRVVRPDAASHASRAMMGNTCRTSTRLGRSRQARARRVSSGWLKRIARVAAAIWLHTWLLMTTSRSAQAQDIRLMGPGPLERTCILLLLREATPARWEWAYWNSLGGLRSNVQGWSGSAAGIGSEVTTGVLSYRGFPAGPYASRAEVRAGVWGAGVTRPAGGLLEGGVKLHLGALYHASWGTFDLRAGGGYGAFVRERSPHVNLTVAYGVRSALERYSERGVCDPRPSPKRWGLVSVARLFITYRRELAGGSRESELVLGLELSPSFLFPPYNWFRWGGGPPR